jgi:hypothetical protein
MPSNVLAKSSQWLEDRRSQFAASTVEYLRGSQTASVSATIGKTTFDVGDGYGVLVRSESRDFLILAADLVLAGSPILPARGDRIQETDGAATFVYEVTAPGKEPCWRWSDAFHKTLRIHTKEVEAS